MFNMEHALALALATVTKIVDGFFMSLPNLLIGLVVLAIFLKIGNFSKLAVGRVSEKARLDITLTRALGTLASVFISLIGLLTAAVIVIPKFSMASVISGLGISSVAIGFAFKDILQNFFAGMLLLWQKPFSIGDQIKTQSFEGTVEDIRIRSTLLRTFIGELVLIPNGDIYTNPVIVATASGKRQIHLTVSAKDADSVETARASIMQTVTSIHGVLKDPAPQVFVSDASSDALNFDVYIWCAATQADVLAVTDRVASKLRELFRIKQVKTEQTEPAKPSPLAAT